MTGPYFAEHKRKVQWKKSYVWYGKNSCVRLINGKYYPYVVIFFGDDYHYAQLPNATRTADTLEQAIEWEIAAERQIEWGPEIPQEIIDRGAHSRAQANISVLWQ